MNVNGPSSKAQVIAQYLIAYETIGKSHSEVARPAALQVFEKLRGPLSTLTGVAGFRSIQARALTLTKREVPALAVVQIKDDGSLEGLNCTGTDLGNGLLLTHLIGLLMTFVGDALTMRLLTEIWPNLLGVDFSSGEREQHD